MWCAPRAPDKMSYDPLIDVDRRQWLALSEQERLEQVQEYHRHLRIKLPNANLHALMHVIVENQLAEQYEPTVGTLTRLVGEGLDRHDAIHAIASIAAEEIHDLIRGSRQVFDRAAYERRLTALTAAQWTKHAR